jgi:hypothetical protein
MTGSLMPVFHESKKCRFGNPYRVLFSIRPQGLDKLSTTSVTSTEVQALQGRIRKTVASHFGERSREYQLLFQRSPSVHLEQIVSSLMGTLEHSARPSISAVEPTAAQNVLASSDIFVVHGRDGEAKAQVQLFLERASLQSVVLHEQASGGRTINEQFEEHAGAAGFAVVLLTPDDVGDPTVSGPDASRPRARQNVVLELGWFAGKLGRRRVARSRRETSRYRRTSPASPTWIWTTGARGEANSCGNSKAPAIRSPIGAERWPDVPPSEQHPRERNSGDR